MCIFPSQRNRIPHKFFPSPKRANFANTMYFLKTSLSSHLWYMNWIYFTIEAFKPESKCYYWKGHLSAFAPLNDIKTKKVVWNPSKCATAFFKSNNVKAICWVYLRVHLSKKSNVSFFQKIPFWCSKLCCQFSNILKKFPHHKKFRYWRLSYKTKPKNILSLFLFL